MMERYIRKPKDRLVEYNTAETKNGTNAGINHTDIFFLNRAAQCGQRITPLPSVKYSPKSLGVDLDKLFFKIILLENG